MAICKIIYRFMIIIIIYFIVVPPEVKILIPIATKNKYFMLSFPISAVDYESSEIIFCFFTFAKSF